MGNLDYKQFTERHRPHIHPPGAVLFVTHRLAGSIPGATLRAYKAKKDWLENLLTHVRKITQGADATELNQWLDRVEKFNREWFIKFEDILHKTNTRPMWMKDERVASTVAESLHKLDGDAYRLDAYSVMSNHVHAVFKPLVSEAELLEGLDERGHPTFTHDHPGLSRIMHLLKGGSARKCNLILSRAGQFWEHESFDHFVREGRFYAAIKYVLNNPVKAGLVKDWREWRWNYCRRELADELLSLTPAAAFTPD